MLSLAVTSSTSVVGVAVGEPGAVVEAFNQVTTDRRHAEELTPLIAATLAEAGAKMADVEQLVVDVGPGRFTGLRVGLATVRALALAIDRPVVGLTSLEILAAGASESGQPVLAVIDARRAEVFQQQFEPGPQGALAHAGPAIVGRPEDLAASIDSGIDINIGIEIVGDGADRYQELYGAGVRLGRVPSAAVMLGLARGRQGVEGRAITPLYLRDPDVNVNVKTRNSPR